MIRRRVARRNPRCRIGVTVAPLEDFATHVAAFHAYRYAAHCAALRR